MGHIGQIASIEELRQPPADHPHSSLLASRAATNSRTAMNVQVVGCSHHGTGIAIRERLAFGREQAGEALTQWRSAFRDVEGVLLSTCNRVEIYAAGQSGTVPDVEKIGVFLARFHRLDPEEIVPRLFVRTDEEAVRHLFRVAASLDSMVLGEP